MEQLLQKLSAMDPEQLAMVLAGLFVAILNLASGAVKAWRWVFADRSTPEQKELFDALLSRLVNQRNEWRLDPDGWLVLTDEDCHLVQRHSTGNIFICLGDRNVEPLLTRSQRKQLDQVCKKLRQRIYEETLAGEYASAISEARRPLA